MRALVWFRSDLRVRDNTALHHACARATRGVVAVFTICPGQWREHDLGGMKVEFVLRNLRELSSRLEGLNIPLKVLTIDRFDGVPEAIAGLMGELECDGLFFNREYEVNELRRDEAVTARVLELGREVHAYTDQVMVEPGRVRTNDGAWYKVFTPFSRAWAQAVEEDGGIEVLRAPRKQAEMPIEPDAVPESVDGFDLSVGRDDLWPAGEAHAASRLRAFIEGRIDSYKERRDSPAVNGTSTMSPYLTLGVVSPRQCVRAGLDAGGQLPSKKTKRSGPNAWISELVWREFYKHVLVGFPRVSMGKAFQPQTERIKWSYDEEAFEAWREGRTGYPIVDAAMRQLNQTGWMHNRLRMIVAMFLTKDLLIDWRWGERYFMQRLVDGDLASNNGGWQWSASTGTDAAPYFRIYNPTEQGKRHDPEGAFVKKFVPELAELNGKFTHEPWELGEIERADIEYPERMVDHAKARERVMAVFQGLNG